jgi:phospholipid/cholesterol/gamma-HCH transport system substrate-binding protein
MRPAMNRILTGIAVVAAVAAAPGCEYHGAESLPVPGAISGDDTYAVTVVFSDATNLVPKESCRSNDTVIGSVESVELDDDLKAVVVCRIKDSVQLPANAVGALRETSLLGERFVALDPAPGQEPRGRLAPDSTLPEATARVDPNVEMVLGALSQVLNGGSLGSIETITRELTAALRGSDLGGTVRDVHSVVEVLDDNRDGIAASLVMLDRLSTELADQRDVLGQAIDSIPGGLAVLDRQRPRLVATLRQLSELSRVALPLIQRTKANTVADLEHLAPVLSQLTKEGDELALTLERVVTFPFPSNALSTIKGDYGGFYGTFTFDVDSLNYLLGGPGSAIDQTKPGGPSTAVEEQPATGPPEIPLLGNLVDLLGLDDLLGLGSLLGGGS